MTDEERREAERKAVEATRLRLERARTEVMKVGAIVLAAGWEGTSDDLYEVSVRLKEIAMKMLTHELLGNGGLS